MSNRKAMGALIGPDDYWETRVHMILLDNSFVI